MKAAAKRLARESAGWVLLVAGVIAIPAPGPGLLILFAGLLVLSQQYEWAERRVDPVKYRALKGAAESVENGLRIAVSAAGVLLLVACGVLWIADPPVPGWWPFADWLWLPGGWATGVTQIVSAAMAVALLVYAYRRFHGKPEAVAALEGEIEEADEEFERIRHHDD